MSDQTLPAGTVPGARPGTRRRLLPALAVGLAASTACLVATAPGAGATGVTFTLVGGALSITQPSAVATLTGAAQGPSGTTMAGSLGSTTVNDARGVNLGWVSTISMTDFSDGATGTLAASAAKAYVPGVVTTTGTVVATAGTYLTALTGLALSSTAQTFVTGSVALGANSATFTPSISVAVPSSTTVGTYTSVVTQTVS